MDNNEISHNGVMNVTHSGIKETLMKGARENGICAEGYNEMRNFSLDELVDYYIKNPDWCMERDFPGIRMLASTFSNCRDKGIFIKDTFFGETMDELQAYIFHNCKGEIETRLNVEKAIIPMFYFANGCDMHIHCGENIKIPIYIFGHNHITTSGNADFHIYKHQLIEREEE